MANTTLPSKKMVGFLDNTFSGSRTELSKPSATNKKKVNFDLPVITNASPLPQVDINSSHNRSRSTSPINRGAASKSGLPVVIHNP
jgi:hypothetical protein